MVARILVDHGSRNPLAHRELEELTAILKESPMGDSLFFAHMEIAAPLLSDVLIEVYQKGYRKIEVFPLFFFSGKHLTKDIPQICQEFVEKFPEASLHLGQRLSAHPLFIEFLGKALK